MLKLRFQTDWRWKNLVNTSFMVMFICLDWVSLPLEALQYFTLPFFVDFKENQIDMLKHNETCLKPSNYHSASAWFAITCNAERGIVRNNLTDNRELSAGDLKIQ